MSATFAPSNLDECRGKTSYPTRPDASKARLVQIDRGLTIYHCAGCGGYHLGRSPKNTGRPDMRASKEIVQ